MTAILYLILTFSFMILAFSLGRYPFLKPNRNIIFIISVGFTILSSYLIYSLNFGLTPYEIFLLTIVGVIFFKYGRYRKIKYGSLLYRIKSGDSLITVTQNQNKNYKTIVQNGTDLMEVNLSTGEPLSKVLFYPHITELFNKPPKSVLCIGTPTYSYASYASKTNPNQSFEVIIEDPVLYGIINNFFYPPKHGRFRLINTYPRKLSTPNKKYDLIFIDPGLVLSKIRHDMHSEFLDRDKLNFYKNSINPEGTLIIKIQSTLHKEDLELAINKLSLLFRTFKSSLCFIAGGSDGKSQIHDVIYFFGRQVISNKILTKNLRTIDEDKLTYPKNILKGLLNTQMPL